MIRLELFKDTTVTSSWYDIWAAAIAVRQLCVVQGRSGQALDVGMLLLLIKLSRWFPSAYFLTRSPYASILLDQNREPIRDVREKRLTPNV